MLYEVSKTISLTHISSSLRLLYPSGRLIRLRNDFPDITPNQRQERHRIFRVPYSIDLDSLAYVMRSIPEWTVANVVKQFLHPIRPKHISHAHNRLRATTNQPRRFH